MPSGYQLRAARSLIGWSQTDLARASELHSTTITGMEKAGHDAVPGQSRILQRIINALAKAGVEFTELGVVLTRKPHR